MVRVTCHVGEVGGNARFGAQEETGDGAPGEGPG